MFSKKKNNKGFTLVELLVVIAIIGILAVVALPALFKNIDKAKVADLEADISALKSASMSYVAEENAFPQGTGGEGLKTIENIIGAYNGELENLSNPFKATYTLAANDLGMLTLKIDLPGTTTFSVNSLKKIYNDLGSSLTLIGETKPNSESTITTGANSITILLMEAHGVAAKAK